MGNGVYSGLVRPRPPRDPRVQALVDKLKADARAALQMIAEGARYVYEAEVAEAEAARLAAKPQHISVESRIILDAEFIDDD